MENFQKKCPRCRFEMTDHYCVRCGYIEGNSITNVEQYSDGVNDLELMLKEDYQKILHNKNSVLIFIMGPLYFCYRKLFLFGTLLFIVDIMIRNFVSLNYSLILVEITWVLVRFLYTVFADSILIGVCKIKIRLLKRIFPKNYQKILEFSKGKSIAIVIIYFVLECLLWYYIF